MEILYSREPDSNQRPKEIYDLTMKLELTTTIPRSAN